MPRPAARLATLAWIALVVAITGASFFSVLGHGFVWDDGPFIVWNESLRGPGTLQRIAAAGDAFGTGGTNPYYRPVTTLSFAIDRGLFGENPAGYHATNLLLHLVVSTLVFLTALKHTGRRIAAGAAALLFAVHPATVEPVAYISARADLLCAAFMLGAWLLYLRWRETDSTRDLAIAGFAFAFALLAKIVALALLPVLALREILLARRRERRYHALVPFGALAATFLLLRALLLEKTTWESGVSFTTRLATAGHLLLEYLRITLLPFNLKIYYDEQVRTAWGDPAVFGGWAVLAGCAVAWLLLLRRRPVIALGMAWFFAALFPVSGIVDLIYPSLMADRYLYIPLAGAALAVAGAIPDPGGWNPRRLPVRRLVGFAAGGAALIASTAAFAITTARRVPAWHSAVTLWEEGRRGAPGSFFVLNALGWAYWQANRLDESEEALTQAAALAPDSTDLRVNLATVAFLKGDVAAAARYTEQALEIDPRDAVALRYRGMLLAGRGQLDLAIESLTAAIAADPSDPYSVGYLAELTSKRGEKL